MFYWQGECIKGETVNIETKFRLEVQFPEYWHW